MLNYPSFLRIVVECPQNCPTKTKMSRTFCPSFSASDFELMCLLLAPALKGDEGAADCWGLLRTSCAQCVKLGWSKIEDCE